MKRGRNQRRRQGVNINRAYDSNGPDVRIRGTANQIYDKYLALARDAFSSGDRVKAENYLQHAEHYFRVIRSMQAAQHPHVETNDGDGEQPAVGGAENERPRERQREHASEVTGEASAAESGEAETTAEPVANGHAGEAQEQANAEGPRRPRRRRPRRSARPDGEDASESEESAEVAAG